MPMPCMPGVVIILTIFSCINSIAELEAKLGQITSSQSTTGQQMVHTVPENMSPFNQPGHNLSFNQHNQNSHVNQPHQNLPYNQSNQPVLNLPPTSVKPDFSQSAYYQNPAPHNVTDSSLDPLSPTSCPKSYPFPEGDSSVHLSATQSVSSTQTVTPSSASACAPGSDSADGALNNPNYDPWTSTKLQTEPVVRTSVQHQLSVSSAHTTSTTRSSSVRSSASSETADSSYFSSAGSISNINSHTQHAAAHTLNPLQSPFLPQRGIPNTQINNVLASHLQRAPSAPEVSASSKDGLGAETVKPRKANSQLNPQSRQPISSSQQPVDPPSTKELPAKLSSSQWDVFWGVSAQDIENGIYNKYDVSFQSELHAFVHSEFNFVHGLKTFLTVFDNRPELERILGAKEAEALEESLFRPTARLIEINEAYLLSPFLEEREAHTQITPRTKNTPMLNFLADDVVRWIERVTDPFFSWARSQGAADSLVATALANSEFESFVSQGNTVSSKECQKRFDFLKGFPRNRFPQYNLHFGALQKFMEKKEKQMQEDPALAPEQRDASLLGAPDPKPVIAGLQMCIERLRRIMTKFNEITAFETSKAKMEELERVLYFKHEEHKMPLRLRYNPKEPHLAHELVAEKELLRKKGSWEGGYSVLLLDHLLLLVRKEPRGWAIVERPIHLELLRVEAVSEPEYKSAIYNTINRSAPQSTRTSVSQYTARPSVTTLSGQEGVAISPVTSTTKMAQQQARSPSVVSKSSVESEGIDSPQSPRETKRPSNLNLPSPSFAIAGSGPSTPVTPTAHKPSTPSTPQTANFLAKDLSYASQAGLVYPIKLINLARDEKSSIAFERQLDRHNFVELLQATRRRYHATRFEQKRVPIGLKVVDGGSFPSTEHHMGSYADTGIGDAVERAVGAAPTRRAIKFAGDVLCGLDIVVETQRITFVGTTNGVYGSIHSAETAVVDPPRWKLVAALPRVTHMEANLETGVLLMLSNSELKFSKLAEIQSLLLTTTTTTLPPPQEIYNSVRCFRTGMLCGSTYLFFSKLSKAQDTGFTTTVIVYKLVATQAKEKRSKGFGKLINTALSHKPHLSFLEAPPARPIPKELFSPSKVVDFSFFETYFFFHTLEEFCHMPVPVAAPQGIPSRTTLGDVLKKARFPSTEHATLLDDLSKTRPVAVARMSRIGTGSNAPSLLHCFHRFAVMSVSCGDLYVPPAQSVNGTLRRLPYRIPYLHKIHSAYLMWPYLLLFSANLVEVRLVTARSFGESLVQVITGRNVRLLTGRAAPEGKGSAGGGDGARVLIAMEHPDPSVCVSVVFEVCKNPGVVANDVALKSALYDLDRR